MPDKEVSNWNIEVIKSCTSRPVQKNNSIPSNPLSIPHPHPSAAWVESECPGIRASDFPRSQQAMSNLEVVLREVDSVHDEYGGYSHSSLKSQ